MYSPDGVTVCPTSAQPTSTNGSCSGSAAAAASHRVSPSSLVSPSSNSFGSYNASPHQRLAVGQSGASDISSSSSSPSCPTHWYEKTAGSEYSYRMFPDPQYALRGDYDDDDQLAYKDKKKCGGGGIRTIQTARLRTCYSLAASGVALFDRLVNTSLRCLRVSLRPGRSPPADDRPGITGCTLFCLLLAALWTGLILGVELSTWMGSSSLPQPAAASTALIAKYANIWGGSDVKDQKSTQNNLGGPSPQAAATLTANTKEDDHSSTEYVGVDEEHLHGMIGVDHDGKPAWSPQPLTFRMTQEQKVEAHRGYCFNTRVSDSLPLDRSVPDFNDPECARNITKLRQLPSASVVIVFYNENLSVLLRSVHSVLNRSPPNLLKEVVLVDDFSDPETHPWLQQQLEEYVALLPKTKLRRLVHRHGLMMARTAGVEWATGEVIVFLDSHIECAANWLQPLLARVQEDRRNVVVPWIHTIGFDDFRFQGSGLSILGFSWSLGQAFISRYVSTKKPTATPIMAGGLFAIDKSWFLELGGYDAEMRLYGGEEMEISFKIWQCGGRLELVPCSRVGHVFRSSTYWIGQVYKVPGEEIHRNKLRAALVWMDEYAEIAKMVIPKLPKGFDLGSLEEQKAIRKNLQCKSFDWFLKTVYPELHVPRIDSNSRIGAIHNAELNACLDTLGNHHTTIGAYPCHFQHGTQAYLLGPDGQLSVAEHGFKDCLKGDYQAGNVAEVACADGGKALKWAYDSTSKQLRQGNHCLEVVRRQTPKSPMDLVFVKCNPDEKLQQFNFALVKEVATASLPSGKSAAESKTDRTDEREQVG